MSLRRLFSNVPPAPILRGRAPIRAELFGIERLEDLARSLAAAQPVVPGRSRGFSMARRLADNAAFLLAAHRAITTAVVRQGEASPAAEWLIDNYHLVDMQVRQIGIDLPTGYYRELPKVAEGPFAGLPRVFAAAWALVAHTDSHFALETLRRYLLAYQEIEPLSIGELWAMPVTLRIALIENLRRVAQIIVENAEDRRRANLVADRLLAGRPGQVAQPWAEVCASLGRMAVTDAFAVQLGHRLRGHGPDDPTLTWLDRRLAERGSTMDAAVQEVLQTHGAANATIQNIITSLRLIAAVEWSEALEHVCLVDGVLAGSSSFLDMDFPTRNLYRTAIEQLARGSGLAELEIARRAAAAATGAGGRQGDPGYHLLAGGRPSFEDAIGFRPPLRDRLGRACRAMGIGGYGGVVIALAACFTALPLWGLASAGIGAWWLVALGACGAVSASDAAIACVNRLSMWAFGATTLPALELRTGIPASMRTMVAVPTLLTSPRSIAEQVARLEVHYLASADDSLHFALLSDWTDSPTEHADGDAALLATAAEGIARLNRLHGAGCHGDRFLLLHRRRVWSAGEACWMGWERKRGKLHELNRLLRGAADTTFLPRPGLPALPTGVRYVVTLDADTRLPRDTVRRLIGKMAHPLNAPRVDPALGRVVEGYAVLQPRVTPSLSVGRNSSLFQRIFSSMDGIDPYAGAVSDVYQDLFGEGSYAGKGIYDIDAFEAVLAGRVPESALLSHDLLEGTFARAALASDIEVVEEFPTGYAVAALRQHRWARGDWQLLPWIMPWSVRPADGIVSPGALPTLGRWKMLDNLRRTLSAPAAILAFIGGWLLPFGAALGWTFFVLATIALPTLLPVIGDIVPRRRWVSLRSYLRVLGRGLRHGGMLAGLIVVVMAHQAVLMGDAIGRTLFRVFVSRRRLLEWVTAAQATDAPHLDMPGYYHRMAGAPLLGVLAFGLAVLAQPWTWLLAAPFALAWVASPAIAYWASQHSATDRRTIASTADLRTLRLTARRTWRYFETFVTPADNMLPPDNFQEDPAPVLARRTSPTNFGLYLLSTASAHDFGWIGLGETVARLEATLATMARLERFRGHFFNWYDTANLRPLEPRYVSTVDSGNLAGHLIALASACREWRAPPRDAPRYLAGLADTVDLASLALACLAAAPGERSSPGVSPTLAAALQDLHRSATGVAAPGESHAAILDRLDPQIDTVESLLRDDAGGDDAGNEQTDLRFWVAAIRATSQSLRGDLDTDTAAALPARLMALERIAHDMAIAMEFGFLRNDERKLLSIGYLIAEGMLDGNCYDLLASEARLASFVAIAKGDVAANEWFRLGRAVTPTRSGVALMSWSGSMFEYLMPSLIMRAPSGSLLEHSNRLAVQRQIEFGRERGIPWGVSESAYNVRDHEYTYQYSNFGVPDLGYKRGLDEDFVVAPYATALAAMVDPSAAVDNLARLAAEGGAGRYGFYEALDYTPGRVPEGAGVAVVRAFMAHHQGMTIVAIADAVLSGIMRARFHAEPMIEATELLLQESAPRDAPVARPLPPAQAPHAQSGDAVPPGGRRFDSAQGAAPATHLLCNGRYTVMLTSAGSGYSRWNGLAVTRWREDPTLDDWGSYIYLRDADSGQVWSAGLQPCGIAPDEYDVSFSEDRAEFARRDGTLTTTMEVLVSTEEDAEVRRISLSNAGGETRIIDITSYAELALAPQAADRAHPAFAKLFVQTEHLPETGAILATRRRRTADEPAVWAAHLAVGEGSMQLETDRARFVGRGHDLRDPAAMAAGQALTNTVGTVLDPVFAIRRRLTIAPGTMARVEFWTMAAPSRAAIVSCIDKHHDVTAFDRVSTLAWTQAQVQLRHLDISPGEADLFQRLAGHLLFAGPALRPASAAIRLGAGAQSGLWPHSISGDLPILLLRIDDLRDIEIVRQMLRAHEYFRLKQLAVDLVILNDHAASYSQELQDSLDALVRARPRPSTGHGEAGSVYLLRTDRAAPPTAALLAAVARVVLIASRGLLAEQLDRAEAAPLAEGRGAAHRSPAGSAAPTVPPLEFFNGLGGFAEQGREYVVVLAPGQATPAPWINVVANPGFGFLAAAEGSGYSWAANSRDNQLTPWSNDPVSDRAGEVFYLQDDDTQALWHPTAAPRRDPAATYIARHGRGYSRFERLANGIASSLVQFVPLDEPVKISRLRLRNTTNRSRSISVCAYVEWVLGAARSATAAFVQTEHDSETGALFARNPWSTAFGNQVAFIDFAGAQTSWTGDRRAFLGRNGTLAFPHALRGGASLPGTLGAGLDPCGALRTTMRLAPGGEAEIVLFLGAAEGTEQARALVARLRTADLDALQSAVGRHWDTLLGAISVRTPDRSMDIMLNGWLLYQTLACRVWARAGFYQASGAYGFRDQLQDGMALTAARPDLARAHLLRAAARQFIEGDVQHWWLPQAGDGVRTRISDDCAWLATAVAHYLRATADTGVLDEPVAFLEAPLLAPNEHDRFCLPETSTRTASLFEHCALALDRSLAVGRHGLPLIGTGDWNDGMNRVGAAGAGESVWLGWFLHTALSAFLPLAEARGDTARAAAWRTHAAALAAALERAWDGDWYLRAYFDDGTPLGSHADVECRIDAISQSWAVLSGVAHPARAARAMASMAQQLIHADQGLMLILAPPFDTIGQDPGYIRAYPPGIRENGGQYTHAALWSVQAFASLGDGDTAARLFAMLNPINHALTAQDAARYKVEPYVAVADIYATSPHIGRGGWSWYTGSAGWMQRVGVESILGIRLEGAELHIAPCIPAAWPAYEATIAWRSARYVVTVANPAGRNGRIASITLDGAALPPGAPVTLRDDGASHVLSVVLGPPPA